MPLPTLPCFLLIKILEITGDILLIFDISHGTQHNIFFVQQTYTLHNYISVNHSLQKSNKAGNVCIHNTEECLCNHCCSRKSINTTFQEYVSVAFVMQHAICMCHIVICGLPVCNIFPHYLINGMIFENSYINKMCVLISSTTFLILRITDWDMIQNVHTSSCKVPVILV